MIQDKRKEIVDIPTRNAHASTLTRVGTSTLLAWFGGTKEGDPDVDIYLARRENSVWMPPAAVASEADLQHWNPVLFAQGDHVTLFYKVGSPISAWRTHVVESFDGGAAFTAPKELVPGDIGGRGPVRNKPIRLMSGRILAPASVETPERWDAFVDISDDGMKTFRKSAFVPLRRASDYSDGTSSAGFPVKGKGVIQPTLWQSPDGTVHMLLRSTEGVILRSDSADEGDTWSTAVSAGLLNNNSGIDAVRMDDGRIALVLNPVGINWGPRTPLSLYVSTGGEASFQPVMDLETEEGEYSYPAIISEGARLFISYTWKRLKIAYWEITLKGTV
ncbi:MAG: exo-alpha-sialidase [Oscillospiraceae bacterium]|nr:exo-alpha-sialidase [Oscillospiraceae bacterium]